MIKNINNFTINLNSTIKTSLIKLNISSHKCLLVLNDKKKLIGTVSDGDIRKALLKNFNLNHKIKNFYNKNPIKIDENKINNEKIKKIFQNKMVDILPVINSSNEIISIFTWSDFLETSNPFNRNTLIVIMAGGVGKRLLPLTKFKPKALIEIGNEPMIKRIIEKMIVSGFDNFTISINYKKDLIKKFINKNYPTSVNFNYIEEKKPLGTIGSVKLIKNDASIEYFIVINCDTFVTFDFKEAIMFHQKNNSDITVITSKKDLKLPFGQIKKTKSNKIINILEKPNFEFILNVGCYILNKNITKFIPSNKPFDAPDLLNKVIKKGLRVYSYDIQNYDWMEIGHLDSLSEISKNLEILK